MRIARCSLSEFPEGGADMPGRFGATITIDKPIDDVFAFLADGENDKRFSSRIVEIAKTTDRSRPGSARCTRAPAKRTAPDLTGEAPSSRSDVAFEPPSKIRWTETVEDDSRLPCPRAVTTFVPEGQGTQADLLHTSSRAAG